jgi:ABC-type branched-subunit amino acid transport system substrate-binding protein
MKIKKILYSFHLLILFSTIFIQSATFETLQDLMLYANQNEEYPPRDNIDILKPDYTSFYKTQQLGFFAKKFNTILEYLHLKTPPVWTVKGFEDLILKLTKQRELESLTGEYILKLVPNSNAKFVVWGDLHGAFHSLVRCLNKLKKLEIIDNNLKIIKPDHYFIFNGNVIDQSPYILETLTTVMQLIKVNPNKVFYLRGKHESKEYWHNFGIKRELDLKTKLSPDAKSELLMIINRFFQTLPLALYLQMDPNKPTTGFIRISYWPRDEKLLDESQFADFLLEKEHKSTRGKNIPNFLKLKKVKPSSKHVEIKAIIKGQDITTQHRKIKSLNLSTPDKGATAWNIFSSPTETYRIAYEFFYDSFALIENNKAPDQWTITSFSQDVRNKIGFRENSFNLLTGQSLYEILVPKSYTIPTKDIKKDSKIDIKRNGRDDIVDVEKINFGSTLGFTGVESQNATSINIGLTTIVDKTNNEGGINGKKIQLTTLDDEFDPKKARKAVEELLQEDIDILLFPYGSYPVSGYLDLVKTQKVLVVFPNATTLEYRKPDLKYFLHYLASGDLEAQSLIQYAIDELQLKKIAIFYEKEPYSESAFIGAKQTFEKYNLKENKDWIAISHTKGSIDTFEAAKRIKSFNPEAIAFMSLISIAHAIMLDLSLNYLQDKTILATTALASDEFKKLAKEKNIQLITSQLSPNPKTSQLDIVKEYRNEIKKTGYPLSHFSLDAYISGSIFMDILKKIKGEITKEKIIKETEKIKNYDFKGLKLNFNPERREIANNVWLDIGKDQWIKYPKESPKVKKPTPKSTKATEKKEIIVGSTLDLTGPIQKPTKQLLEGLSAAIKKANRTGNTIIKLTVMDDNNKPTKAKKNIEKIQNKFKTNIFLSPTSSNTLQEYLPLIKNKKILVVFPKSSSMNFRKKNLTHIVHFLPTPMYETQVLINYAIKDLAAKKFVVIYQKEDPSSKDAFYGAKEIFDSQNLKENVDWIALTDKDDVAKIQKFSPEAIVWLTPETITKKIIQKLDSDFIREITMFANSFNSTQNFKDNAKENNLTIIYSQLLPDPETSELEIAKEYREEVDTPNKLSFEGYINASILIELLNKIDGEVTKEKIIEQIEQLKNYEFKGLKLNYNPKTQEIFNTVWIQTKDKLITKMLN